MRYSRFLSLVSLVTPAFSYQIYDIWQTTWDRSNLFTDLKLPVINFGSPGAIGQADIVVDDTNINQQMDGVGAALTDSSAQLLSQLKSQNSGQYWSLLNTLFNPADGAATGAFTALRVPLGASDFSPNTYSFDDVSGDTNLTHFSVDNAPSYLWSTLQDIQSINSLLKVFVLPWSPPGWMKDSGTMNGGSLQNQYNGIYAQYLYRAVKGLAAKGITPYGISVQNEPENSDSTYPTASMSASQEASIGKALRPLLDNNGFSSVKIIAFDHNWVDANVYPVDVMNDASSPFAGASFHCYEGDYQQTSGFTSPYPNKEVYFSECTGELGTDWWSNIKWNMDNLMVGMTGEGARTVMFWNVVLDPNGNPKLPGTDSCGGSGCRGVVSLNSDGSWSLNEEYYLLAQTARAIVPRDVGGPFAQRVGVSVNGNQNWALRVQAYATGRKNPSDWTRYSLVVLNWNDGGSNGWNPQPVTTTIEFRGQQATYTFPVGMTTLWWYGEPQ